MSTVGPCLHIHLGQPVRRLSDPVDVVGFIVGVVFREPREVLVRWADGESSYEREDALTEAL